MKKLGNEAETLLYFNTIQINLIVEYRFDIA